jgi:dTDP-4-amino-4,6-dideoxygalactose transaminase
VGKNFKITTAVLDTASSTVARASGARPLAILGGAPAFDKPLHVGRPNIGDKERLFQRFNDIYERRWLSNYGACVRELEERLRELLGVRHCIPICNATVALEIASRALDLHGEVIVPSFTFIATAHSLQWQGITPVFCDIDPQTHNIDARQIEQLITPRTAGIMGVHLWGRACDTEAIEAIARRHKLKVMYDAAHAFGCTHGGRMVGNFGSAEVFSFHATKFINTGEGGAIATNDDELAAKIRLMKNFGFAGLDHVVYIGTNGKMDEFSAAMGLTNLESMNEYIAANARHYATYRERLGTLQGVRMIDFKENEKHNFQYVILEIDEQDSPLTRDELATALRAENVLARRYFHPGCHRMEPYATTMPAIGHRLPNTEQLCNRVLALPTGTVMTEKDVTSVCDLIHTALGQSGEIRAHLASQP